jgi:hypothetical protein
MGEDMASERIHQIVIVTLSGFSDLCQQLAYLVFIRIFQIAGKFGESLESNQEYPGKQEIFFVIAAQEKNCRKTF